jgi:hypothetical protein
VFSQLPGIKVVPFAKTPVTHIAHYATRKYIQGTDQFKDCCILAGVPPSIEFTLGWTPSCDPLVQQLRGAPLPVVFVGMPRAPMARTDGFGAELLTAKTVKAMQAVIDELRGLVYFVQIGTGEPLFGGLSGIDLDLAGKTTVSSLFDIATSCGSGFIGHPSFVLVMAEALNRPGLYVWSRAGLLSNSRYIRAITPAKVFHRKSSRAIIDDAKSGDIATAAATFYQQIRDGAVV